MSDANTLRHYLASQAAQIGFTHHGFVKTNEFHASDEIRGLCRDNVCGFYGKNWMCPPAIGEIEILEARVHGFREAILVQFVDSLEDSFDFEGMQRIAEVFDQKVRTLRGRAQSFFAEHGAGSLLTLAAGACRYCETCSYVRGEACVAPEEALSSAEAYGFNLGPIVERAGLSYVNGTNTVSFIGFVFFGTA